MACYCISSNRMYCHHLIVLVVVGCIVIFVIVLVINVIVVSVGGGVQVGVKAVLE